MEATELPTNVQILKDQLGSLKARFAKAELLNGSTPQANAEFVSKLKSLRDVFLWGGRGLGSHAELQAKKLGISMTFPVLFSARCPRLLESHPLQLNDGCSAFEIGDSVVFKVAENQLGIPQAAQGCTKSEGTRIVRSRIAPVQVSFARKLEALTQEKRGKEMGKK